MTLPSKTNPLPNRMQDSISIPEFNERMAKINEEAEKLAIRANRIYKANNPDDHIDTGMFDKNDFIKDMELVIPQQAQELFDFEDARRLKQAQDNANQIKENIEKNLNKDEETTVEDLQKQLGGKPNTNKEKINIKQIKNHPILSKLKEKFGIKEKSKSYITKVINDVKIIFEFPTALTTNFAIAIATGECVGTLDFANAYELARCSMSIVSLDDVSVAEIFAGLPNTYDNIPYKVRKLCGFEVMQFLQKMPEKELDNILSFFRTEVAFEEMVQGENNVVELECINCHKTRTVPIDEEGNYDIRYCDRCGTKLIPTNTTQTDANIPLA